MFDEILLLLLYIMYFIKRIFKMCIKEEIEKETERDKIIADIFDTENIGYYVDTNQEYYRYLK